MPSAITNLKKALHLRKSPANKTDRNRAQREKEQELAESCKVLGITQKDFELILDIAREAEQKSKRTTDATGERERIPARRSGQN
jgi:hypothetical protein